MFSLWKIEKLEKELGIGRIYEDIEGSWSNNIKNSEYLIYLQKLKEFNLPNISYPGISKWNIKRIDLDSLYLEISQSNKCREIILKDINNLDLSVLSKCGVIFSTILLGKLNRDEDIEKLDYTELKYEDYYLNNYLQNIVDSIIC